MEWGARRRVKRQVECDVCVRKGKRKIYTHTRTDTHTHTLFIFPTTSSTALDIGIETAPTELFGDFPRGQSSQLGFSTELRVNSMPCEK